MLELFCFFTPPDIATLDTITLKIYSLIHTNTGTVSFDRHNHPNERYFLAKISTITPQLVPCEIQLKLAIRCVPFAR